MVTITVDMEDVTINCQLTFSLMFEKVWPKRYTTLKRTKNIRFSEILHMLISRDKEKKTLLDALQAEDSQFIAVYGRRRVGKTYLIRQTYSEMLTFEHSGLAKAGRKEQIQALLHQLKELVLKSPSCRQIGLMPLNY